MAHDPLMAEIDALRGRAANCLKFIRERESDPRVCGHVEHYARGSLEQLRGKIEHLLRIYWARMDEREGA